MKVLVASFAAESNAAVRKPCTIDQFIIKYGKDVLEAHGLTGVFESEGIEPMPTFYAFGHSAGLVDPEAYQFCYDQIMKGVREHLDEIDGVYLHLHGASSVIGLPESSADHVILRDVRKLVGEQMPIAVVMDPHGNVTEEFASYANIVRAYRESPHTDEKPCHRTVAHMLAKLMKDRVTYSGNIRAQAVKIPILLGGERCVSADEPLHTINQKLDVIEADPKILSATYLVGYLRHDDDKAGACVAVSPAKEEYSAYAMDKAKELASWVWDHRRDFHFTGVADEPDRSVERALAADGFAVITDSGDNMTAGAAGYNTFVLRQFLALDDYYGKKVLITPIVHASVALALAEHAVGDHVSFDLGVHEDELSSPVHIEGVITAEGEQHYSYGETENMGPAITVKIDGKPIYVTVVSKSIFYIEFAQFKASGLNPLDYDICVVKQGYIFPDFKKNAKFYVMSLTDGSTNQRTERMTYRRIRRPMFPIDQI